MIARSVPESSACFAAPLLHECNEKSLTLCEKSGHASVILFLNFPFQAPDVNPALMRVCFGPGPVRSCLSYFQCVRFAPIFAGFSCLPKDEAAFRGDF